MENLKNIIQVIDFKKDESIEKKANKVPIGSVCFFSVSDYNIPIDTPFNKSPYGAIIVLNIGRPIIFAINHIGEFYIKMKTGSSAVYTNWVKI